MCLITILAVVVSLFIGYIIGVCGEKLLDWIALKKAIYQEAARIVQGQRQAQAASAATPAASPQPQPAAAAKPKRAKKQAVAVATQVVDVQPPTPPQP